LDPRSLIVEAVGQEQVALARELIGEWCRWLEVERGVDLSYQDVRAEIDGLPGAYAPPAGGLWLAYVSTATAVETAGCVALRPVGDGLCELKRLYVRPAFRGSGLGRALAVRAIARARAIGYRAVRLDTAAFLPAANRLYAHLGFREVAPYSEVPAAMLPFIVFMELTL
jgi:GNAT superfamily N-acetyltransferase